MSSILKELRRQARLDSPLWSAVPVHVTELMQRMDERDPALLGIQLRAPARAPFRVAWYEGKIATPLTRELYRVAVLVVDTSDDESPAFYGLPYAMTSRGIFEDTDFAFSVRLQPDGSVHQVNASGHFEIGYHSEIAPSETAISLIRLRSALVVKAHALLSARNIALASREPIPRKSGKPSGKYRGIVWHEIVVTKKPLAEGASKIVAAEDVDHVLKREHLARGHFKDFTRGPGLFGNEKLRGRYWWSPHVRGTRDEGTVFKEYVVGQEAST